MPIEWEEYYPTRYHHAMIGWGQSVVSFPAFAYSTAAIIPALLGRSWDDETTAMVVGRVAGCDDEAMGLVQLFPHDNSGNGPATGDMFYADDNALPSRSQGSTNPDNGLYFMVNMEPGEWTLSAYGWDGSAYVELGATPFSAEAGGVSIVNVYVGHSDGVVYPDSCSDTCE
jgi:hypothetical protein